MSERSGARERPTADLGRCLVTGAAGYLGRHLARELLRRGHRVRGLDLRPLAASHDRLEAARGDVTRLEDVRKACEGVDTVFHTAAVLDFRRFAPRREAAFSFAVNVEGVRNVVRAARDAGAKRLVHTSSNNVTFAGPVIDGDESLPYARGVKDLYTRTKIAGEEIALAANGEGGLLTCAIRPGGIYGPGEEMILPRVVAECASGRFVATLGDGSALSDNTYIENLVAGQIEAARHLVPGSKLGGRAYFVTDGAPVNYFAFFRPIVEGLGFPFPRRRVPARPLLAASFLLEWLHAYLRLPAPPLTHLEVRKVVVSHWSRIDRARSDFGYAPRVRPEEAIEECIAYCRELLARRVEANASRG
jgi:3beta-hydroxy-delta5-steroid dehydrogenase/steroid delta-isomerase